MKMGKIIAAVPVLQKLADEKLTLKTLYKVSNLLAKLDKEISFYNKERLNILESLGNNVQGDKWKIPPEKMEEFQTRTEELLNLETDTDIKAIKLPTSEPIQMSYNEIKALEGFVELDDVE